MGDDSPCQRYFCDHDGCNHDRTDTPDDKCEITRGIVASIGLRDIAGSLKTESESPPTIIKYAGSIRHG